MKANESRVWGLSMYKNVVYPDSTTSNWHWFIISMTGKGTMVWALRFTKLSYNDTEFPTISQIWCSYSFYHWIVHVAKNDFLEVKSYSEGLPVSDPEKKTARDNWLWVELGVQVPPS